MAQRTILVVDDEPPIRSLLKTVLGRAKYKVLEAGDGLQALDLCAQHGPTIDLILTDIVMPKLDGIRLADEVSVTYPHIRVLYMSGKCEMETVERNVRERGFGFIRKPFSVSAVVDLVKEHMAAEAPRKAPTGQSNPGTTSAAGGHAG